MRTTFAGSLAASLLFLGCSPGGDLEEPEQIIYLVGAEENDFVEFAAGFRGVAVYGEYASARRVTRRDLQLTEQEKVALASIRDDVQLREECNTLDSAWRKNRDSCRRADRDATSPSFDGGPDGGAMEAVCNPNLDDSRIEYIRASTSPPGSLPFRCPLGLTRSPRLEAAVATMKAIADRAKEEGSPVKE